VERLGACSPQDCFPVPRGGGPVSGATTDFRRDLHPNAARAPAAIPFSDAIPISVSGAIPIDPGFRCDPDLGVGIDPDSRCDPD
jgi:hypothetical protein